METKRMGRVWMSVAGVVLMVSCATPQPRATATILETSSPIGTSTIELTATSTATPSTINTPSPTLSFKVLSYNILYGAGVERQFDSALPPEMIGKSRLPELLSFIRDASPDIVGLQEANGWDRGLPPTIEQVAQQLGMNEFFARTAGGFHLGLLTRFTILDAENLSSEVGRQGALRATLISPLGERIYVFVVHLDPSSSEARLCEVNTMLQLMQPYAQSQTILFGDMNFRPVDREYNRLDQAGWKLVAVEPSWGIDQIWISSDVNWQSTPWFKSLATPSEISDHKPIGAQINLYAIPGRDAVSLLPSPTPIKTNTPTAAPTPIFVADALAGVSTLRQERFDDPCAASRWNLTTGSSSFSNGMLEASGMQPWQTELSRQKEFLEGQGVTMRFQAEAESEFEIYFDNSGWNTDLYRRFGINVRGRSARAILWQGNQPLLGQNLEGDLQIFPGQVYSLLLAAATDGELIAQVWEPTDPSQRHQVRYKQGDSRTALPWVFKISANKGKVSIDSLAEIKFDGTR
jgi:endonuclease/exonuclease/phosphatase family metal-dependent hydrolase